MPKLMLTAQPGAIMTPAVVAWCNENLPNLTTADIGPGSHFVQEDNPHGIGQAIVHWVEAMG